MCVRAQAPYSFSKRNPEAGANWWPGRQCQFFEFNWYKHNEEGNSSEQDDGHGRVLVALSCDG